jgi:predicted lipoprotein with Yx(FWY)xxD motif
MRLPLVVGATSVLAITGGAAVAQSAPAAHAAGAVKIKLGATSKLGRFLVSGKTLYLFEKDKGGKSACYGQCAKFWPALTGRPSAGPGVSQSKLGTVKRTDGTTQVTYNGHPLYFFAEDKAAGQANGEGSTAFGAGWYVVGPGGNKIDRS